MLMQTMKRADGNLAGCPNVNGGGWMNSPGADGLLTDEDSLSLQTL